MALRRNLVVDDPPEQSLPLSWCRGVGVRRRLEIVVVANSCANPIVEGVVVANSCASSVVEGVVAVVANSCGRITVEGVVAVVAASSGGMKSAVVFSI